MQLGFDNFRAAVFLNRFLEFYNLNEVVLLKL